MASFVLYLALFVSGLVALLYEILWQRLLVRITGATLPATVEIFSLFMLGLAVGSFLSIRQSEKVIRPWKLYAAAELLAAISGVLIYYLCDQSCFNSCFSTLSTLFGFQIDRGTLVSCFEIAASVVITIATAAMGAAFNFGLKALLGNGHEFAEKSHKSLVIRAYALNVGGAAVGSVCGAFLCLPNLGLTNTTILLAGLSLMLSVALFIGESKFGFSSVEQIESTQSPGDLQMRFTLPVLAIVLASSFISMSLETMWVRLLCLVCGSSTYAVGSVLAAILLSLSVSAYVATKIEFEPRVLQSLLSGAAACAALFLSLNLISVPFLTWAVIWGQSFLANISFSSNLVFMLPRLSIALGLIFCTTFSLGLITPLAIKTFNYAKSSVSATAYVLIAGTIGSILGGLITAFVFIPSNIFESGIEATIIFSVVALSALSVFCSISRIGALKANYSFWIYPTIAAAILIVCLHPAWQPRLISLGPSFITPVKAGLLSFERFKRSFENAGEKCLFYKEGASSTVTVDVNERTNVAYLKSNGKIESALPLDWRIPAPTSDYKTQLLLGIVPVLACGSDEKDLHALTIGFGSGITSGLILSFQQISKLIICEIEPGVYRCAHFFDGSNFQPLRSDWLRSRRVEPQCIDGRAYLNRTPETFDLIVSQPSEPWVSGSSDLFTIEFFKIVKSKLHSDGVFVQWLQLYCIDETLLANLIATFHNVFPDTYILHPRGGGDVVLIGKLDGKNSNEIIVNLLGQKVVGSGASTELLSILTETLHRDGKAAAQPIRWGDLLDCDFILTPNDVTRYLKGHQKLELNTDGKIAPEYRSPQEVFLGEENINANVARLRNVAAH